MIQYVKLCHYWFKKKMGGRGDTMDGENFLGIEMVDRFLLLIFFFFSKEYIIKGTFHWEEIVRIVTM